MLQEEAAAAAGFDLSHGEVQDAVGSTDHADVVGGADQDPAPWHYDGEERDFRIESVADAVGEFEFVD